MPSDPDRLAAAPCGATRIAVEGRTLGVLFAASVGVCLLLFVAGFMVGRGMPAKHRATVGGGPPVPPSASRQSFVDPKCGTLPEYVHDGPRPTDAQMAHIHRLLPGGTRILDTLRVDASPRLAFVLHLPRPHDPGATELTMFRFTSGKAEREDLGSYCFIPDVVIGADGRAFAAWSENPTGGNAWSCSSLTTMVIDKREVCYPEIESDGIYVAKDLIVDRGVPVLIVWDTRFEYFEGLCRACSPIQMAVFELGAHGAWADATSRHRALVKQWIQDEIENLAEAMSKGDPTEIGRAALSVYLHAETAGCASQYRKLVTRALTSIKGEHFVELIEEATRRKCRLMSLVSRGGIPR